MLTLDPWGGAEDVDEEEVCGQDGGQVPDELVRGGRDLEVANNIETVMFTKKLTKSGPLRLVSGVTCEASVFNCGGVQRNTSCWRVTITLI